MNKSIWNISNLLSLSRVFLSVPLAFAIINDEKLLAFVVAATAYITDLLDGWAARKFDHVSEMGKIIDPIADKVFIGTGAVLFIMKGVIPLWFALAILARDILIVIGGIYVKRKIDFVLPSNYTGKVTVGILSLCMVCIYLEVPVIRDYGLYIASAALLWSFLVYSIRTVRELRKAGANDQPGKSN